MKAITLLVCIMIMSIASSVFAAEAEHVGGDFKDWAFKIINFASWFL